MKLVIKPQRLNTKRYWYSHKNKGSEGNPYMCVCVCVCVKTKTRSALERNKIGRNTGSEKSS